MRPTNGVHQGCKIWNDIRVGGRMIFARVGVIVLPAVRSIAAGKVIGALCVNKVDFVKGCVWGVRLEGIIGTNLKC